MTHIQFLNVDILGSTRRPKYQKSKRCCTWLSTHLCYRI